MGFWTRLRIFVILIQLVRNPNRTDLIFKGVKLASSQRDLKPLKAVERWVMSHEDFHQMYEKKELSALPKLDDLKKLDPHSFGYAVYEHMNNNGLSFDLFPLVELDHPISYISARIYQDHDLWHVLFGKGIEVEDELAIQAVGVAQIRSPISTLIIAGGLLHLLGKDPLRAVVAIRQISDCYQIAQKAKFLLGLKLNDLFPLPLVEVRERCGIDLPSS